MKHILYIFLILPIIFVSCTDEEEPDPRDAWVGAYLVTETVRFSNISTPITRDYILSINKAADDKIILIGDISFLQSANGCGSSWFATIDSRTPDRFVFDTSQTYPCTSSTLPGVFIAGSGSLSSNGNIRFGFGITGTMSQTTNTVNGNAVGVKQN